MTSYIAEHTIIELAGMIRSGIITSNDLVDESLGLISDNDDLHAFISVFEQESRSAAEAQMMLMASGYDLGPLQGIPIAVKDNIDCDYGKTTYGSSIFREYQADKNAIVVSRLKKAGAIIVGKTNLHEFAWGGTTDNPHYGTAKNPWNQERIPAGSSGGVRNRCSEAHGLFRTRHGYGRLHSVTICYGWCLWHQTDTWRH